MYFMTIYGILALIVYLAVIAAFIYLFILLVKALKKYLSSKEVREEKNVVRNPLGKLLKEHRIQVPQIYWLFQNFMESVQKIC